MTDAQKQQAKLLIAIPWETFKRSIVVYRYPAETLTESTPEYNFGYPEQSNPEATVIHSPVSGVFDATIEYLTSEQAQKLDFVVANTKYKANKSVVRISVRESGRAAIVDAERIEFDNANHFILAGAMPRGLFEPDFFDFWLQSTD